MMNKVKNSDIRERWLKVIHVVTKIAKKERKANIACKRRPYYTKIKDILEKT